MGERKSESFAKRSGAFLSVATCGNPQQLGAHKRWGGGGVFPSPQPQRKKREQSKAERERESKQTQAPQKMVAIGGV